MRHGTFAGLATAFVLMPWALVTAGTTGDAAKAYAEAKALLVKADFEGARSALRAAVETDPDNRLYRDEYALLRQIIRTREEINKENDSARWMGMAGALRAYYHSNKIYGPALELDREIHRREQTASSAAGLAETLLASGRPTEAIELLRPLPKSQATARTNVLLGLALARAGQLDQAKGFAREVDADTAEPRVYFEFACLRALLDDSEGAIEALTRYFQETPPDQLDEAKAEARLCGDFRTLAGHPGFTKAFDTRSTVSQSTCSGGSDCGSCPLRKSGGTCAAQGGEQKQDKP